MTHDDELFAFAAHGPTPLPDRRRRRLRRQRRRPHLVRRLRRRPAGDPAPRRRRQQPQLRLPGPCPDRRRLPRHRHRQPRPWPQHDGRPTLQLPPDGLRHPRRDGRPRHRQSRHRRLERRRRHRPRDGEGDARSASRASSSSAATSTPPAQSPSSTPTPSAAASNATSKDYAELSPTPDAFERMFEGLQPMQREQPNYSAADLASITVPVTVAQAEHDEFIKPEHAEYIAPTIPGARYVVAPRRQPLRPGPAAGGVQRGGAGVPARSSSSTVMAGLDPATQRSHRDWIYERSVGGAGR